MTHSKNFNAPIKSINYENQYNKNYMIRYEKICNLIKLNENHKVPVKIIADVADECFVKGILFLQSSKKLSIFNKDNEIDLSATNDHIDCYINEKCHYWIEDFSGKTEIIFNPLAESNLLTTGCVLGFLGNEKDGKFICNHVIYPEEAEGNCKNVEMDRKILIFSNLLVNTNFEKILPILDFYSDQIDDVLFIGTVFDVEKDDWDFSRFSRIINQIKGKLYIVPGKEDPTSSFVPQNPLHPYLFVDNDKIVSLSNPGEIVINGKNFIFADHKLIVKDIMRYKKNSTPITALELMLKSRQMCPSAPDTIPSIPFSDSDPFFITKIDFLIGGGDTKTESKIVQNKFLLAVPDFTKTNTAVILSMKDLKYEEITIN
ncbi:hypothetical protein NUSPORA_01193 [Nucleospora cyclopteri]